MEPVIALVFAKYPDPGRVKTRLVPPLTPTEAAQLHLASLRAVCENLRSHADLSIELVITPDESLDDFRDLFPSGLNSDTQASRPPRALAGGRNRIKRGNRQRDHRLEAGATLFEPSATGVARFRLQGEGDLGCRLARTCDEAFADHDGPVLLFGADSPTLPTSLVDDASRLLKTHDAVLGPCDDGGYHSLGLARPLHALFEGIDWGSEHVADQTRRRAIECGIDLVETDSWYDLDRFADLPQAVYDLAGATASSPDAVALRRVIEGFIERYGDGRTD